MRRCTYCKQRAVNDHGLCYKCGHNNSPFDYFMHDYGPIILVGSVLASVFVGIGMLVGST